MTFLEQVCVHESGHCLAALKHGAILTSLRADGQKNECRFKHPGNFGSDPERVKEVILIACSGPAAEQQATGQFFNAELYRDEMRDLIERLAVFDRYHLPENWDVDDFWAAKSASAKIFVLQNFQLIRALGQELRKRVTMTGQQCARFLEEASPLGRPKGAVSWGEYE